MATPFYTAFDSIATPNGTWIKPGGNVVAYVRSTGVQSGDLSPIADLLVATIAQGVARCRPGMNDVVGVLPGHTETVLTTLFTPVVGAQIVGMGMPGAANAPNVTLSATAATIALSAANMSIIGLNINSATAAVVAPIAVTAAGVTIANCFINFTGALAANVPILATGAANLTLSNNHIVANTTATVVSVVGATSTNILITGNLIRSTSTGTVGITLADTAGISGFISFNLLKLAAAGAAQATIITAQTANLVANVGVFENYAIDNTAGSGSIAPVAAVP
jgi:hypothetical protein